MIDVQKLLGQMLAGQTGSRSGQGGYSEPRRGGQPAAGGGIEAKVGEFLRGPAGAAIAGGIAARLFRGKGFGKMGGSALKLGGAAAVAGLAYKAWQSYQQQQGSGPPPRTGADAAALPDPSGTAFLPRGEEERRARLMLSAMIAAAKADGHIDAAEQDAIFGRIDEAGLGAEERGYLMDEMRRPATVDDFAREARGPEEAAEVYAASLLAIDVDHEAERDYLRRLADGLRIDPALVRELHRAHDEAAAG